MTSRVAVKWIAVVVTVAVLASCTAPGPRTGFAETDDAEPFSRAMLDGNKRLDRYVLRPAAQGYDFATPLLFQTLITNGIAHLSLPKDFVNYVLQGDVDRSLETFGRIFVNTIVGAGGFLDPATEFGLARQETDFGLTLADYGVGEGTYLVLPLLGPTTVRDFAGFVVDRAFSPATYVSPFTSLDAFGVTVTTLDYVDTRNRNFEVIDEVLYESEDSYITLRAAYLQRRRAQVAGEEGIADTLPDIFDEEAPSGTQEQAPSQ